MNELISIIMPAYNSEEFINESIDSVLFQTYRNLELLIIDDCSNDRTVEIIENYQKEDSRIRLLKLESNRGAAYARNEGIKKAMGEYVAFLDSDDLWRKNKLEEQKTYMDENKIDFCCTYYNKINYKSEALNEIITYYQKADYKRLLLKSPGNSTVMYNSKNLGKIFVPDIRKRNDYLMWLQIIKKTDYLHSCNQVLSSHRIRSNSLSSKKFALVNYHWKIYRNHERLSVFYSLFLIVYWVVVTSLKLRK